MKPRHILNMFLTFWHLKPYVFICLVKHVHARISYRKKCACQKDSSVFYCMHTSKRALIGRESDAGGLDFRDMQPCTFNMSFQIENSHMY